VLDPRHEARAARDLTPQRAELEVGVRVDQPRQHDTPDALDGHAGVARQNVGGRPHSHDDAGRIEHDRAVRDR